MKPISRVNKKYAENFVPAKRRKMRKRTRFGPKKAKPGAFWVLEGMGTVENGSNQMRKPCVRTRMHQITMQHMKKENRRKPSVFAGFLAGAEGLEPSARGFGVDVGTHQRERRRGGVARSPRSSPQRAVLIWCYEESEVEKACRAISFSSPTTISFCLYRATGVGNEITTC